MWFQRMKKGGLTATQDIFNGGRLHHFFRKSFYFQALAMMHRIRYLDGEEVCHVH
jgi:hypothetical protein